jgi:hypothetical protein
VSDAIDVRFHRDASAIEAGTRECIAAALDRVADQIWDKDPNYWRQDATLFLDDSGIVVAWQGEEPIGFLVYQRMPFPFGLVLVVKGVNILPAHQNRGLIIRFCRPIVQAEVTAAGGRTYLAARTRSPVVLSLCARLCSAVVPALNGAAKSDHLLDLAQRAAQVLLPGAMLELPSMIIRDAYSGFHYREPPHHRDRVAEAIVFDNTQLRPTDAFFVFGEFTAEIRAFA